MCEIRSVGELFVRGLALRRARVVTHLGALERMRGTTFRPQLAIIVERDFVAAARRVKAIKPYPGNFRVLVVGVPNRESVIIRLLAAGADGVVTDEESIEKVRRGIADILADRLRPPPNLIRPLLDRLVTLDRRLHRGGGDESLARLSAREVDVLDCLGEGLDNKAIALKLHLETQTVKNHVSRVLRKLKVGNRYDAGRLGASRLRSSA